MSYRNICILGGTGFVGQHLATRLTRHGYKVRVLTRHRERYRALIVNPDITLLEADIHDPGVLRTHLAESDAAINLVGILNEGNSAGAGFDRIHVELPRKIIDAATAVGMERLLHMSALNAAAGETRSRYLKTKGLAEDLVHAAAASGMRVTSFRPSIIFGPGDSFFNRFATLLRFSPPVFPLACPDSRFAPVCVTDVAEAFCRGLDDATAGERLELCGPETWTLKELVEYTRDQIGVRRCIVGLGDGLSQLQARILGYVPGKPFTMDNYYSLQKDSVCTTDGLASLGISPAPIAAVVPGYLAERHTRGRYHEMRRWSRRT
ncbi:MAG: complex I NDUFA9 subunit family protein [Gammaproteobacteria bacterium]